MWSTTVSVLRARTVIRWLALAAWPMHLVFGASMAAATAVAIGFDQPGILGGLLTVGVHYVCGLCASFAIHELGHAVVLRRAPGVTAITGTSEPSAHARAESPSSWRRSCRR